MSLNDPRWGSSGGGKNGDNQGPPDLEELWRNLNRRLSGMMGKRGAGGGDGDGRPPLGARQFGGGIGVLIVLVLVIWLASGFYIVDASQRGVVLQFGKFHETSEPGLRWRLPYPIQTNELVNLTGVRTVEVGYRGSEKNKVLKEALMLTDDENIINIQFAVQYILKDPQDYLFNNRDPDDAVVQAAETAIREIVGKSKMDFVLYEGREQIAVFASKLMQDILDRYATGIQISKVTMQNAQPPEQVQAAFDDAVKSGQDRERQKSEGQAYANDVIPRARGTASRLAQEAEGYRQRVIATAEGDVSRFRQIVSEYAKAPDVTRQRMYIETVQQVMTNVSKVMVDARSNGNVLFLPLDKLVQAAAAGSVPAAGLTTPSATAGGSEGSTSQPAQAEPSAGPPKADLPNIPARDAGDFRSRESGLRSRERGDR
ncbi:MAG: FtsH protease activity modulator HflK [Rhodocyclaceae bacterium]